MFAVLRPPAGGVGGPADLPDRAAGGAGPSLQPPGQPRHRQPRDVHRDRGRHRGRGGPGELGLVDSWSEYSSLIGPDDEYCGEVACDWWPARNTEL